MQPINAQRLQSTAKWLSTLLAVATLTACSQLHRVVSAAAPANTAGAAEQAQQPVKPLLSPAQQQQFDQARQLLQQDDTGAATAQFSALFQALPQAPGVGYNLALSQWRAGDVTQAQQTLAEVVRVAADYPAAHNLAGVLARQQGSFHQAERHFQRALQADAGYAIAHKNLAFLYELYLGKPRQAQFHYQRYYALTQDEQAKIWLALLQQQVQQQVQQLEQEDADN